MFCIRIVWLRVFQLISMFYFLVQASAIQSKCRSGLRAFSPAGMPSRAGMPWGSGEYALGVGENKARRPRRPQTRNASGSYPIFMKVPTAEPPDVRLRRLGSILMGLKIDNAERQEGFWQVLACRGVAHPAICSFRFYNFLETLHLKRK